MNHTSLFAVQAELYRAMANATGIEIIHALRAGTQRVRDISRLTGRLQSMVSHHLAILRNAGIMTAGRRVPETLNRITNPMITDLCDLMMEVLADEATRRSRLVGGLDDGHSG